MARRQGPLTVRLFGPFGHLVEEDQIEIGGHRHLAATELAESHNRHAAPGYPAMAFGEIVLDRGLQRGKRGLGNVGKRRAGFLGADLVAKELDAGLETAVISPASNPVEDVLE